MTTDCFSTVEEVRVPAKMRDGTVLRARVTRPDAPGRFPVLLTRTPYGTGTNDMHIEIGRRLAERGYVVVFQDIRGRYESDGDYNAYRGQDHAPEALDGYDTVEWAAALPWSNGNVGTMGNSYNAWSQWALAKLRPPHLKAMWAQGCCANLLDRHLGGVPMLGRWLTWLATNISVDQAKRLGLDWYPETQAKAEFEFERHDRSKWLWYLPLWDLPEHAIPGMREYWRRMLSEAHVDHYAFERIHSEVNVPVLHGTGWYDQQVGTIGQFVGMRRNGHSPFARDNQHLIVGPWGHTTWRLDDKLGDMDFGTDAPRDYFELTDSWFSQWLKGRQPETGRWPRVQYFVMGANRWSSAEDWPPPGMREIAFHLRSGGRLAAEPPADEPVDQFTYDPRDPVMTRYSMHGQRLPLDHRRLDGRPDILRYETPPLEQPVEIAGPISVVLHAASSALDTDFTAKLHAVWPDGVVQELSYGVIRARYRGGYDTPQMMVPGEIYEFVIKMHPTAFLFSSGFRIRVDISSSDFPNFDRNHNTGGDDIRETTLVVAHQSVFHDAKHPSRLLLPVIS